MISHNEKLSFISYGHGNNNDYACNNGGYSFESNILDCKYKQTRFQSNIRFEFKVFKENEPSNRIVIEAKRKNGDVFKFKKKGR